MADFHLQIGGEEAHRQFDDLPEIARGFLEAAFFLAPRPEEVESGEGDPCPMCETELTTSDKTEGFVYCPARGCGFVSAGFDNGVVGIECLHPESWTLAETIAADFWTRNHRQLSEAESTGYDLQQAGRDLFLAATGAGVGFLDREELPETIRGILDESAKTYDIDVVFADEDFSIRLQASAPEMSERAIRLYESLHGKGHALPGAPAQYGAPMGRPGGIVDPDAPLIGAHRVSLDAGGYDAGGAYWGHGAPLWHVIDSSGGEAFVRAMTRAAAIREASAR